MHATIGSLPEQAPIEQPRERLISIPYLLLRATTAGGAFAMGFVQTFVFARILSPERFSIFIVVGGIGYTLWLTDLGLAKILFINLRAHHLAGRRDETAGREAAAVILFYGALAVAASLVCFLAALAQPAGTLRGALELSLFLLYITLNLAWFSLRTISIAVDLFVYFERLELVRRVLNIATLVAMLGGLPFIAFLIGSNVLWAALFATAVTKLISRGALVPHVRGFVRELVSFFRLNSHAIARSGTGAISGMFIATFPYYFVPLQYRPRRGAYYSGSDVSDLPRRLCHLRRDLRSRDPRTDPGAGGARCRPPDQNDFAGGGAVLHPGGDWLRLLIFAGGPFFKFLLRAAATVPPGIVPILVVLLLANILQIVSEALLQYSGFFRSLAYNGAAVSVMMIVITGVSMIAKFDIVGFLAAYAAVYTVGAICLTIAAIFGPIRAAAGRSGEPHPLTGLLKAIRGIRPAPTV